LAEEEVVEVVEVEAAGKEVEVEAEAAEKEVEVEAEVVAEAEAEVVAEAEAVVEVEVVAEAPRGRRPRHSQARQDMNRGFRQPRAHVRLGGVLPPVVREPFPCWLSP
jgi:hypothetical protein